MGKLSIFLVIAIIFVALFGATGVFAVSSSNYHEWFVDKEYPLFSQIVSDDVFAYIKVDIDTPRDTWLPLFNNVYFKYTVSGSNATFYFGLGDSPTSYVYYNGRIISSDSWGMYLIWRRLTSSTFELCSWSYGNNTYNSWYRFPSSPGNFAIYNSDISPTFTFGSSNVFSDGNIIGELFSFTIPTGYALLIQGACDILERDYAIYNSWNFYQNDARRVNGSRERVISTGSIVDGFSFDHNLTYSQAIQWIPRNANLFGSSSNYDYSDHTPLSISSGSTFLISNPQYIGTMENVGNVQTKENTVPLTGTIYFEYTSRPTFKYIALESQIDFNQVGVYYNVFRPDVYEEIASTTVDGTDVIVSPDYTGTTVPPDGGNSGQPPYNPDETVEGVLSNFINNIRSLISSATQAISELVNTGSSFMQSIATMFTWLPSPLLSVIIGGLTILVVVGVLKVLWR